MTSAFVTHLWQSTFFACVAGLLTLAFRKNRAQVRYWLWLSASLKFFVPFALLIGFGTRLGWEPVAQKIATPAVTFAVKYVAQPFPATLTLTPSPVHRDWTPFLIIGLWLIGSAAITLVRLRLWLRVRDAVRGSVPLDIPSSVRIRAAAGLVEPGVVGLWRPILLLPEGIVERLTASELEAVIAHELCHVRRRDNLFSSIHMLAEALFWFHPLVWWIGARLLEERERACDESVLSLGNQPRVYADAILNVCKLYTESPLVCVSGVTGSDIKRRIEAIMMNRIGLNLNRAKKLLLASAGVATLVGPVAVGALIAVGHLPAIHAQTPIVQLPLQTAQIAQTKPQSHAKPDSPVPAPAISYQDRRLVAMLFDFGGMTADEQSKSRQTGIQFIENSLRPADLVAIMSSNPVTVAQDFTDNKSVLESAVQTLSAGAGAADADTRLANIETASKMLAPLTEKKALVYFSGGITQTGIDNREKLLEVIAEAKQANMAIFPVDTRGVVAGTRAANPQFTNSEMSRTYTMYGPPDATDVSATKSAIWRYNYLPNFHSSTEFEFSQQRKNINYPPPLATYTGTPATTTDTGLPVRHTTMGVYPAGESSKLTVPLDSLSGVVDIIATVNARSAAGIVDRAATNLNDSVTLNGTSQSQVYSTGFLLEAGSYVCKVLVREASTRRIFTEAINFDVK
jgi:beta-lactamase regulating signal transducer with metallopeptidase domain